MTAKKPLPTTPCPKCVGTGQLRVIKLEAKDGKRLHNMPVPVAACPTCSGTGRIPATNTSEPKWRWYSFCSAHHEIDPACTACHGGEWINENDPRVIADHQLFKDDPKAWRKKHNLATPALQDEREQDRYRPAKPKDPQEPYRPPRPSAKRIEPLKPRVDIEGIEGPPTPREMFDKIQELITAHNESQGKQE